MTLLEGASHDETIVPSSITTSPDKKHSHRGNKHKRAEINEPTKDGTNYRN
jgi:hypothetical protein